MIIVSSPVYRWDKPRIGGEPDHQGLFTFTIYAMVMQVGFTKINLELSNNRFNQDNWNLTSKRMQTPWSSNEQFRYNQNNGMIKRDLTN